MIYSLSQPHVTKNSKNDEYYTPEFIIQSAKSVLGQIDCDPATTEFVNTHIIHATQYYTKETNGLAFPWKGKIWLNPPYSKKLINKFIEKSVYEYQQGHMTEGILLVNNATDTAWCQLLLHTASACCFCKKRIQFLQGGRTLSTNVKSRPLQGSLFVYFGTQTEKFCVEFSTYGMCLVLHRASS